MIRDNIFIYHLDYELQELFQLNRWYNNKVIYQCFNLATRLAILLCKYSILIPASNYFESDLAFKILNDLNSSELSKLGIIKLLSSSYNLDELLEKKIAQHGPGIDINGYHYMDFLDREKQKGLYLPGTLDKRNSSASRDIQRAWSSQKGLSFLAEEIYPKVRDQYSAAYLENILGSLPEKLGEKAYISRYIVPLLEIEVKQMKPIGTIINRFITREYIRSFLKEYHAVCLKDIPLIQSDLILPDEPEYQHLSYRMYAQKLQDIKYKGIIALKYIETCSAEELIFYKNSTQWKKIIGIEDERKIFWGKMNTGTGESECHQIKIGIITALPKEFVAIKMMLNNPQEKFFEGHGAGHRYCLGEINSANGGIHKVALGLCGMGNNAASIRTVNMLTHFPEIKSIIMVGIAGGIPSPKKGGEHVRLGDIVVSDGVLQYDFGKDTESGFKCISEPPKPSAQLLEALEILKVKEYENVFEWRKKIDEYAKGIFQRPECEDNLYGEDGEKIEHPVDPSRDCYPKVFKGKIASANVVLKNLKKRQELKKEHEVLAVEMEASGIADATWSMETGYLVIRGICDYCDSHKNDVWQEYAALAAASYAVNLIENLPSF